MLIGVAQRQERKKRIVIVQAEILGQDPRRAIGVHQQRSVVLHHPARGATGAAGIDQAGGVLPPDLRDPGVDGLARGLAVTGDQGLPVMVFEIAGLADLQRFDPDHVAGLAGSQQRADQRLGQLFVGDDHRAGARILQDVQVVALGIGDIGRHGDAARGHDREIGDAPFGPVFRHQHHPVAVLQAHPPERFGQSADLPGHFGPAQRLPGAALLGPQERSLAPRIGPIEKQFDQIPGLRQIRNINHAHRPFGSTSLSRNYR